MKKSIELIADIMNHSYIVDQKLRELSVELATSIDQFDCATSIVELEVPRNRMKAILSRLRKEAENKCPECGCQVENGVCQGTSCKWLGRLL